MAATDLAGLVDLVDPGRAARDLVGPATTVPGGPDRAARPGDPATTAPVDLVTTDPGGPGDHGPWAGRARRTGRPGGHGRGPGGPGGPWHGDDHRGYFHGAPWGNGPAPWGAGEPPRPAWDRPLPPPGGPWNYGPINYWGYQETPFWNPQFNQFGFNFFGVWIPL